MKVLKEGYTTGTCATAAAKAGVAALLENTFHDNIEVVLPMGSVMSIPIKNIEISQGKAIVTVVKDGGDDPDITHGKDIIVELEILENNNKTKDVFFKAGQGVGIVTKPGLPVNPGEPAINPGPRKMIIENLKKYFNDIREFHIEIRVPEGEKLAKKTLNPHLGIIGGISILGTTGIVKPMSEEAFKVSLVPQIKTTKALGYKAVVLTPGNIGMESAIKSGIPSDAIVITSNFIGYMLENAVDIGFENIIIWGHIGKLVKVAGGNFYTHNRISDSRMEVLAAYLALNNAPHSLIKEVMNQVTTEGAEKIISENNFNCIWEQIADKASERCERYLFSQAKVGITLLKDRETVLYVNKKSQEIGDLAGWNILL